MKLISTATRARTRSKGGIGIAAIKVFGMLFSVAITFILASGLGATQFGVYSFAIAIASALVLVAQAGLPQLLIRETAKAKERRAWPVLKGIWVWALRSGLIIAGSVSLVAIGLLLLLPGGTAPNYVSAIFWGMVLVPLWAMIRLLGATVQGLHKVAFGQAPDLVIRQGLFIAIFLFVLILFSEEGDYLTAANAMLMHAIAAGITMFVALVFMLKLRPNEIAHPCDVTFDRKVWVRSALPLGMVALLQWFIQQFDVILLAFHVAPEEVGSYRVAHQASILAAFALQTVNIFLAPRFAQLLANEKHESLQSLATIGARFSFCFALVLTFMYATYGGFFLGLLGDDGFKRALTPLLILCVGQMINALSGTEAMLLSMAGYERIVTRYLLVALFINVAVNALVIPSYGPNGAAWVKVFTFLVWNAGLWAYARKALNIDTSVFGIFVNKVRA